jgi:hypothetical protein
MSELLNRFASGCRSHRTRRLAVTTGIAGLLLVGFSTSGFASANVTPVVYYACVNHTTHAFQYSTATATCSTGFVKENWNQTGPKGATGAPGPQGPSGFSQIQHGATGGFSNNSSSSYAFVVNPVTVTITSSTEAQITSSAEYSSTNGGSTSSVFGVCSAPSGSSTLTLLTDAFALSTSLDAMSATQSGVLILNGTWDVGLCSANDSASAKWGNGSTTVVIGNYVAPGFGAAKVQPPVLTNPKSAKKL